MSQWRERENGEKEGGGRGWFGCCGGDPRAAKVPRPDVAVLEMIVACIYILVWLGVGLLHVVAQKKECAVEFGDAKAEAGGNWRRRRRRSGIWTWVGCGGDDTGPACYGMDGCVGV